MITPSFLAGAPQYRLLARRVPAQDVRAGAVLLALVRPDLQQAVGALRHDVRRPGGEDLRPRRLRRLQVELHAVLALGDDALQVAEERVDAGRVLDADDPPERPDDIGRRHRFAVVELDALPERAGEGLEASLEAALRREHRMRRQAARPRLQQVLEDRRVERGRTEVVVPGRVDVGDAVGRPVDDHAAGSLPVGDTRRRLPGTCTERGDGDED
jgi:hypothetical protein